MTASMPIVVSREWDIVALGAAAVSPPIAVSKSPQDNRRSFDSVAI